MSELVLYHRVADPASAAVRRQIVERGLKSRIDFQNVDTDGGEAFAGHGGRTVPALWDGRRLHEGETAVCLALDAMMRAEGSA